MYAVIRELSCGLILRGLREFSNVFKEVFMSATANQGALEQREQFLRTFDQTRQRILKGDNVRFDPELAKALQAYKDGLPFQVTWLTPETFGQFLSLALEMREQRLFNQVASEMPFWMLLDQIESECFLQPNNLAIARPFIADLWSGEVAENPFQPPKDWKYLPVEEAVAAYRKIFGSSLKADSILKLAKELKPGKDTEGIPVWLKLSTLARLLEVKNYPLATTDEGREAYARIVELFVPEVGKAFTRAYPKNGFNNWRKGQLSAKHVILAPAGIAAWQKLEQQIPGDDFCFAPGGATTGATYAGHSVRLSRVKIVLAHDQFPQDCIMTGGTIAIQPDRMNKYEHLGMDCPANAYSSDADGRFLFSLNWCWNVGGLDFGYRWADFADRHFGSASFRRS